MRLSIAILAFQFFPLTAFAADASRGTTEGPNQATIEYPPPVEVGPPAPPVAQAPMPCTRFDLHAAVQFVGTSCAMLALRNMDVNDRDVNGDTPLHNAIHFWNPPVIKLLLRNGADIHLKDFEGRNAIELASALGHRRLYDFLLALERETERLNEAVDNDDVVAVSNSLHRGALLGMRDVRLDTPLHRAAQSGFADVGRLLVHHGAALESRNYLGETPLVTAALRDHAEFMQVLLDAGANVNAPDERRHTALDIAEERANPAILAMLKKKKAKHGSPASVEFDFDAVDGEVAGAGP